MAGKSEVRFLLFAIFKCLSSRIVDNSLSFLLSSAQSYGLSHQVIKNLSILVHTHRWWVWGSYYKGVKRWKPQLPLSSSEYDPASLLPKDLRRMNRRSKMRDAKKIDERCWDALGEVVRMAEARHNLSLGRNRLKRWTIEYH